MLSVGLGSLVAAISLGEVSGESPAVRAQLDACNVRLGDPIALTLRFYGFSDPTAIHAPALSKELDARYWRVDDDTAKVDLSGSVRVVTYSLRPLKEGLLEFPELTFSCRASSGETTTLASQPVPLRVRPAPQVALAIESEETEEKPLPQPDGLFVDLSQSPWKSGEGLSEDEQFAWKRACANPTADAFVDFDFPEARFNEAACAILEGDTERAERLYSALDWRVGQTTTLERGLISAAAAKSGDPAAELPMWRQVLRPVLRFARWGRLAIGAVFVLAIGALIWLTRRIVRAVACLALLLAAQGAFAKGAAPMDPFGSDPFFDDFFNSDPMTVHRQMMDRMRQQHQQMQQMMRSGMTSGGQTIVIDSADNGESTVRPSIEISKPDLHVGEPFEIILSLEVPPQTTLTDLQFVPSVREAFTVFQRPSRIEDGTSANPSNKVVRFSIPARFDAVYKGPFAIGVQGMVTRDIVRNFGGSYFRSTMSNNFEAKSLPVRLTIDPIAVGDCPADYTGAVGPYFRLCQRISPKPVCTNDVIEVAYLLEGEGYLPPSFIPDRERIKPGVFQYVKRTVADGREKTDDETFCYYDIEEKKYRHVTAPGVAIAYRPDEVEEVSEVVVNEQDAGKRRGRIRLLFAPSESAAEVAQIVPDETPLTETERVGPWVRVDNGRHAGWIKQEDLP